MAPPAVPTPHRRLTSSTTRSRPWPTSRLPGLPPRAATRAATPGGTWRGGAGLQLLLLLGRRRPMRRWATSSPCTGRRADARGGRPPVPVATALTEATTRITRQRRRSMMARRQATVRQCRCRRPLPFPPCAFQRPSRRLLHCNACRRGCNRRLQRITCCRCSWRQIRPGSEEETSGARAPRFCLSRRTSCLYSLRLTRPGSAGEARGRRQRRRRGPGAALRSRLTQRRPQEVPRPRWARRAGPGRAQSRPMMRQHRPRRRLCSKAAARRMLRLPR